MLPAANEAGDGHMQQLLKTEILGPAVPAEALEFAREFKGSEPFPHVVIPEFFNPEFCQRLLDDFPTFDPEAARNEMGNRGGKAIQTAVRDISPAYRELDDYIQTPEFLDVISKITGIPNLLYDPEYTGGGTHDNQNGQGLDPHVDFNYHPRTGWHRRLNLIVYLNPEWEESWGGNFDLHLNPWEPAEDRITTVLPLFNRGVIFETSERSWHGFEPIRLPAGRTDLSRKSFAIYLYTKERPPEEVAAAHATVYVPRGLPDDVAVDQILGETNYELVKQRFTLHRNMIRFLYQREQRFSRQMDSLRYALDEARASQRLALQGYAVQPGPPSGLWPDQWASEEVRFQLVPTRRVDGLELELLVPAELDGPQVLEITAGEWSYTEKISPGDHLVLHLPIRAEEGEVVEITMHANETWHPKSTGESGDDRHLAFRILDARLIHEPETAADPE
jgi:hypothetical protein